MLQTDRRGLLAIAAIAPFAGALPAFAQDAAASAAGEWDLSEIYPDWSAWDAARKSVLEALPRLAAYRDRLGESAEAMARALADISDVSKTAARVYVYSSLNADEDVRVAENQERLGQSAEMYTQLSEAVSWTSPEVLALGADKVESFIAASEISQSAGTFGSMTRTRS